LLTLSLQTLGILLTYYLMLSSECFPKQKLHIKRKVADKPITLNISNITLRNIWK
jgi:hypothetical protein